MLRQPAYAGFISGKLTADELIPAKHPAIIDLRIYKFNQDILDGKNETQRHFALRKRPEYPLKSVLLHQPCGKPVYASAPRTGGGKSHSPRYQCNRCKGSGSIKSEALHDQFEQLLDSIKPTEGILKLFKEVVIRKWHHEARQERRAEEKIQIGSDRFEILRGVASSQDLHNVKYRDLITTR